MVFSFGGAFHKFRNFRPVFPTVLQILKSRELGLGKTVPFRFVY